MTSNIFEINYNGTGASQSNNALGMREMQERVRPWGNTHESARWCSRCRRAAMDGGTVLTLLQ